MSLGAAGHNENAVIAFNFDQLPGEALILALSAGGRFQFDLSVRLQISGHEKEIALTRLAGSGEFRNVRAEGSTARLGTVLPFSPPDEPREIADRSPTKSEGLRFGELEIDFRKMELRRSGNKVFITALEFKTLNYLISRADEPIPRAELLERVWGYQSYPSTRTVDNRILQLRQKLERNPTAPRHLITVRGVGYKFVF